MTVLAIDPGSAFSAWVLWDGERVMSHAKEPNGLVLRHLSVPDGNAWGLPWRGDVCVIEQIESYGMAVGREVFDTVFIAGRFAQAHGWGTFQLMPRRAVKLHLCGSMKAKDSNIRQALIDRFGGKDKAIGRKAAQGPLYGLRADEWQALALAVTFHDQRASEAPVKAAV